MTRSTRAMSMLDQAKKVGDSLAAKPGVFWELLQLCHQGVYKVLGPWHFDDGETRPWRWVRETTGGVTIASVRGGGDYFYADDHREWSIENTARGGAAFYSFEDALAGADAYLTGQGYVLAPMLSMRLAEWKRPGEKHSGKCLAYRAGSGCSTAAFIYRDATVAPGSPSFYGMVNGLKVGYGGTVALLESEREVMVMLDKLLLSMGHELDGTV